MLVSGNGGTVFLLHYANEIAFTGLLMMVVAGLTILLALWKYIRNVNREFWSAVLLIAGLVGLAEYTAIRIVVEAVSSV
ncbi:hypothetical protein AYO47_06545 [Planctomyces sp. SCGC AG-212-M04]|nr:hypothetical protein AYO47_06545 [Planctomyces sp. SCGC AG-212-M04]